MGRSRAQVNKAHKTRFSSKSSRNLHRTSLKDGGRISKSDSNHVKGARAARLHRGKMLREQKRAAVLKEKRASGGITSAPRVIVLFPVSASVDLNSLGEDVLKLLSTDDDSGVTSSSSTVASSEYKLRATVLKAPHGDLLTCMEMAKVADLMAFVASANSPSEENISNFIDSFGSQCLSVLRSIGLPSTTVLIRDLPSDLKRKNELKKMCASQLASEFPEDCKFFPADTRDELHKTQTEKIRVWFLRKKKRKKHMVKRGTKRKIEIKKITNKYSLATSFTKRSHGLYSKASQLCLLSDAQIAILATPSSSNSNVPFFSFGHSSVEAVVSAFLSGESLAPLSVMETKEMREDLGVCMARSDLGLGHWWDDEERFRNPQEIMEAIESMKSLLSHAKRLRKEDAVNVIDQTLTIGDDTAERDQILSNSDTFCNNNNNNDLSPPAAGKLEEWSDMDLDQFLNDIDDELPEIHTTEEEDHHQTSDNLCSNNNNALLPAGNMDDDDELLEPEIDLDFKTIFERMSDKDLDEFAATFMS